MKKILISVTVIFLYLLIFYKVNAAGSVSLVSDRNTVNIGDTVNVSINLSGASVATLTARINFDVQKLEYVSGPSNSNFSGGRIIYTWTDPTGGENPLTRR